MVMPKMPKNAEKHICEECGFKCSKLSNYKTHLSTRKHQLIINGNKNDNPKMLKNAKAYRCECGKKYNYASGLSRHKLTCNYKEEIPNNNVQDMEPQKEENKENKDNVINLLLADNREMKDMFIMFFKNQAESQADMTKKIIQEVMPLIGNDHHNTTTNSHNKTLNFYLTNTCKDAESINDFTSRFCERIETFFNGNYHKIAHNQISLSENVQTIFFECLDDKSQVNRFIQTTDKKNGIFYVKEQKKDEENKLIGDAEFVKYKDGFDKHGAKLGHAIHKTINPCKEACIPKLGGVKSEKPRQEDYEDFDDYEAALDEYHDSTSTIKENLMFQTHYAMNLFDNKHVRDKTLTETRRPKEG